MKVMKNQLQLRRDTLSKVPMGVPPQPDHKL